VFRATADVIVPVSAGIVIIALVFLPLLSLQGLEGKLFAPVALTIVFALAGSLLLALTLVPVLASFGLKRGHHGEPWIMRWLTPRYRRLLGGAFARKRLVYGLSATGLAVAVLAYGAVGKTFMPTMDEGSVIVQLTKLPTINLAQSTQIDMAVERALKAVPEVADVIARTGSDEIGLDPMGLNETDSFVVLKPQGEWRGNKDFVVEQLRHATQGLPGVQTTFTQPIEMRVSEMLTGARGDLAVKIFGPDTRVLADLATRIQATLKGVRGATEVLTVANDNVDYLQLNVDRVAAGRLGMPVDQLQDTLRASVEGMPAGIVAEGQRRVPIVIRGDDALRSDPTRFADMQMVTPRAPWRAWPTWRRWRAPPARSSSITRTPRASRWSRLSSRAVTWSAMWTKPRRKSRAPCRCPPAIASNGAASSKTSSAPPRG
jgi:cobalt-zinc-cadmium resistance protein CzcA